MSSACHRLRGHRSMPEASVCLCGNRRTDRLWDGRMAVDLHANGVLWGRGRAAEGGVAGLDAGEPYDIVLTSLMEPEAQKTSRHRLSRDARCRTPLMERSLLRSIRSGSSVRILSLVMQMSFAFTLSLPPRASRTCSATSVFAICAKPFLPAAHSSKRPSPQGLPSLPHLFKCVEQSIGLSQTRHGVWLAMTP